MVNVTVSLPDDVASRAATVASARGVTVGELVSEALEAYLDSAATLGEHVLSFVGLGDAEKGFSARRAEERIEAEGFEASRFS